MDEKVTPLMYAMSSTNPRAIDLARSLITAGSDVNAQDRNGNTALMWLIATYENDRVDPEVTQLQFMRLFEILLSAGADLDRENEDGDTPRTYIRELPRALREKVKVKMI